MMLGPTQDLIERGTVLLGQRLLGGLANRCLLSNPAYGRLGSDDPHGMRSSDRVDDPTGVHQTEGSHLRWNQLGKNVFVHCDAIRSDRCSPPSRT